MSKITIKVLGIAVLLIALASCKKETGSDVKPEPVRQKSKLELLCQTWILNETYENNVQKTSNGTDKYIFTPQGQFKFYYNSNWMEIGTFDFTSKDSTAISVLFNGTSNPTVMTFQQIDEKVLNTSFVSGGKNFLYKYKR